ncbi:MAG TPA: hypothetical protein VJO53_08505 [Candidatus Acidoferrales bacterium]|nr:hypothetical protein [Candidatus Acidoferrales bacterium]
MRFVAALVLTATVPGIVAAHSQSQPRPSRQPAADRLGMTCAQVLQMTSSDWIAKFTADSPGADAKLRSIRAYGRCYDERTDRLAASLSRGGRGPARAVRADFTKLDSALKDFTTKALADTAPADSAKSVYAALYEKQFRYAFYQEYEARTAKPANRLSPAKKPPAPATPSPKPDLTPAPPPPAASSSAAAARSDADPMTAAKNRFGRLLDALPEDKMRELHRSFGEVIGTHTINEGTRLAVYRYVIFVLEPSTEKPFSEPPF